MNDGGLSKINFFHANTVNGIREEIQSIVTPEGQRKTYAYDYDTGLRLSVTDSNNHTKSYTYNAMGKRTSITRELGVPYTYVYDENNLVDRVEVRRDGRPPIKKRYNAYHQLIEREDRDGNKTQIAYNADGQVTAITATVDGQPMITGYVYYAAGESSPHRLKEIRRNSQVVKSFTYDAVGRIRTTRDATGLELTFDHNDFNAATGIVKGGYLALQNRDQNNTIMCEYVWGGGMGGLLNMRYQGQDYHYLYNGKGNVSAVLDNTQAVVASYRYDTTNVA